MKIKILLIIIYVFSCINLHSQEGKIIYSDFEPDTVIVPLYFNPYSENPIYGNQTPFDINCDDKYDISFSYMDYYSGFICYIISEYNSSNSHKWFMTNMELNDTISNYEFALGDWTAFLISSNPNPQEDYYNEVDFNIALKHDLGDDNYCYGWIRSQFKQEWGEPNIITLYDMAYCTVPNYPLRVGQKSFDDTVTDEISENKDYVLYPSPAKDKLTLRFNNNNESCNEIKIYTIDGRLLKIQNDNFEDIDVNNLPSGVYIMKIISGIGETFTEKFVKE